MALASVFAKVPKPGTGSYALCFCMFSLESVFSLHAEFAARGTTKVRMCRRQEHWSEKACMDTRLITFACLVVEAQ